MLNKKDAMRNLVYFWRSKGDITSYTRYDEVRGLLYPEYPDFFEAWDNYKRAERIMNFETKALSTATNFEPD